MPEPGVWPGSRPPPSLPLPVSPPVVPPPPAAPVSPPLPEPPLPEPDLALVEALPDGEQSASSAACGEVPFGQTEGSYLGRFRSSLMPGWFGPSQPTQAFASRMLVVVPPSWAGTPGWPLSGLRPLENLPHGPLSMS